MIRPPKEAPLFDLSETWQSTLAKVGASAKVFGKVSAKVSTSLVRSLCKDCDCFIIFAFLKPLIIQ